MVSAHRLGVRLHCCVALHIPNIDEIELDASIGIVKKKKQKSFKKSCGLLYSPTALVILGYTIHASFKG